MFVAWSQWVAIVRHKPKSEGRNPGSDVAIHPSRARGTLVAGAFETFGHWMTENFSSERLANSAAQRASALKASIIRAEVAGG
jgi:hypothetical protein